MFEDDSSNQVGGAVVHGKNEENAFVPFDTEFLFSLANFKKHSGRFVRSLDSVDIVYPSDSPITDSPDPDPTNSLLVSNDVSYVYPQTYNPPRVGRQTFPPIEPVTVLTTISPTTPSPSPSSTTPTSTTLSTNPSLPPSLSSEDYDDWGVVVSVVKSVSESDSSITFIKQHETTTMFEDDPTTTTQTAPEETTTMLIQLSDKASFTEKNNRSSVKIHPFLSSIHKPEKNNSKHFVHKPHVHPFLNQIKSAKGFGGVSSHLSNNGVSVAPQLTTTITKSSSPKLTTTTSTTPTKLFSRFSFLNKGRRPDFLNPAKSNSSVRENSSLKNIQSRLSNFKRTSRPSLLSHNKKKKEDADVENISNDIQVTEKTKTAESLFKKSNYLTRFNSKLKSSLGTSSTRGPIKNKPSKPRPKRLPSPFSGSRPDSLFKPRPNRFFSQSVLEKSSPPTTTSTEKQTVGEIIAHLNGEEKVEEEKSVTLRPNNFKPRFGVSNKIREKLLAELAEVKDEESGDTGSQKSEPNTAARTVLRSRPEIENKLGQTVVTDDTDLTPQTDGQDITVDIVHDRDQLTTNQLLLPLTSTQSPFQVLLDQDHEDHVHDLVHDHHPEIHFRHLKPDLDPSLSVFLPTLSPAEQESAEAEASTVSASTESLETTSPASRTVSRSRSRSRSRYRQPTPQSASASLAEQRRTRLQVRRRNRGKTETAASTASTASTASPSPRLRVRQRSRGPVTSEPEAEKKPEPVSRFSPGTRRLQISRARTASSQPRAPTFRASSQRVRVRGRGRARARTETSTELNTQPATAAPPVTTPDLIQFVVEEDEEEKLLEGKLGRVDLESATEGVTDAVVTVTTLTLNNEENYEETTTVTESQPSTISPGKFKPKFGSETRNRLREKLRQELEQNKTRQENEELNFGSVTENFTELPSTQDTEFSDFDISPAQERDSATTAILNIDYLEELQQPQSRRQRRINENDSSNIDGVTSYRFYSTRNYPKRKRSHGEEPSSSDTLAGFPRPRGRLEEEEEEVDPLLRVGRSTVGGLHTTTTTSHNIKPFLLRGGKGYLKDQEKFSEFGNSSPPSNGENISGPNVDINSNIIAADEDSAKIRGSGKLKKLSNILSQFGVKEVEPSVDIGSSDSVNLGITLDSDLGSTQAPNSLTTTGLVSSLPKLKSLKSKITSGKYKNIFKLRKETTTGSTIHSQDRRIEDVKVDQKPLDPGSSFRLPLHLRAKIILKNP